MEADPLEGVEKLAHQLGRIAGDVPGDEILDLTLPQRLVDVGVSRGIIQVAQIIPERLLHVLVEEHPPQRGLEPFAVTAGHHLVVQLERALLVRGLGLVVRGDEALDLLLFEVLVGVGDVVEAEHHVLRRDRYRETVRGLEDVLRREHQHPRLGLGLRRERHVDRHLVAVEVRVERGADERVDLDGFAFYEHRLESLDAETVKRRGAVQEHGVLLDHVLQHVPDLWTQTFDHLLGAANVRGQRPVYEHLHHERLEQLDRHQARQAALVHLQVRAHHDDRTPGVVNALTEQVLPEASLLALEHVGERLESPVAGAGNGPAATTVVEESVYRLLEHPLLVVHDHVGRTQVEQPPQAVVAVYDAPIQVVQVARGETSAVELDHRPEVRRQHRDGVHDHPRRVVAAGAEGAHDLQALYRLLALLAL